jgi:hypothetical protein
MNTSSWSEKEIEISANQLFTLFVAISLIIVIAFTAETVFSRANSIDRESKEQVQWEYEFDERHGEILGYIVKEDIASLSYLSRLNPCLDLPFSELAHCRNALDEQYQELPDYIAGFSPEQIRREYMLGERNDQTPRV